MSHLTDNNLVEIPADNSRNAVGVVKTAKPRTQLQIDADCMIYYLSQWKQQLAAIKSMEANK